MISKRSLGCDLNDVAPRKRLRSNDFFLSNTVSGARAASLLSDANAAGAVGFDADLRSEAFMSTKHYEPLRTTIWHTLVARHPRVQLLASASPPALNDTQ